MGSSNLNSIDNSHNNDGHGNIPRIFVSDDAADDDDNDDTNDDETADNDTFNILKMMRPMMRLLTMIRGTCY